MDGHRQGVPDEEAVFGRYPDKCAISEHPSEEEINAHYSYWCGLMDAEQAEVLEAFRDIANHRGILSVMRGQDAVEAIEIAIKWWFELYPDEVVAFLDYIKEKKQTLAQGGFSTDRDKSMYYEGAIPDRIRHLLLMFDPDFFRRDDKGHSKGLSLFYSVFKKARIGG